MVIMNLSHNHNAWADVAVFENLVAGRALQAFLESVGLATRIYDDKFFRYCLFLRPPQQTYRIQVKADCLAGVEELLHAKAPDVVDQALHCPSCGSLRVNYPQMTRKFILPTIILNLGIIFRVLEHVCYCENCHEMWCLSGGIPAGRKARIVKPFPF